MSPIVVAPVGIRPSAPEHVFLTLRRPGLVAYVAIKGIDWDKASLTRSLKKITDGLAKYTKEAFINSKTMNVKFNLIRDPRGRLILGVNSDNMVDSTIVLEYLISQGKFTIPCGEQGSTITAEIIPPNNKNPTTKDFITYVVSFMFEQAIDSVNINSVLLEKVFKNVGRISLVSRENPTTNNTLSDGGFIDNGFDKLYVTIDTSGGQVTRLPKGKKLSHGHILEMYPLYAPNSRFCKYCYSSRHTRETCPDAPLCRICQKTTAHDSAQCPNRIDNNNNNRLPISNRLRQFGVLKDKNLPPKQQQQQTIATRKNNITTTTNPSMTPLFSQVELFFSLFIYP